MTATPAEVAIIGAGPVGLFAVFELGMLGIRSHVLDALDSTGGQCQALYPEKPIYDIPGFARIGAAELVERLETQIAPFAPSFHLGQQVVSLAPEGAGWRLSTSKGTELSVKAVIVAAGCGAFGPNRPPLAGIEAFEGKSLFYSVRRREDFRGKQVAIAGGGDSALDWTLALAGIAEKIYLVHRRGKFRGAHEMVARIEKLAAEGRALEVVVPYQLHGLDGQEGQLAAVTVRTLDGEERRLEVDVLLAFFGLALELGPIADWGLDLERHQLNVEPATCMTSRSGIYAIGDIAHYPGKLKLILSGFSEAALAAHAIRTQLHPEQELHWEYSTTKGVPGLA
ncbi:MAG: NAD(P)/FAD-dependent oxidoreductase [Kiloniellales bacterium]